MRFACWVTNARTQKHTKIFNTRIIALFTVTMDTRTRINVTLDLHCLSSLTSEARICKLVCAQEMSFLLEWRT